MGRSSSAGQRLLFASKVTSAFPRRFLRSCQINVINLQTARSSLCWLMPHSTHCVGARAAVRRSIVDAAVCAIVLLATQDVPATQTIAPASAAAFYASDFSKTPSVAAMTEIGRALFFDPALSAS